MPAPTDDRADADRPRWGRWLYGLAAVVAALAGFGFVNSSAHNRLVRADLSTIATDKAMMRDAIRWGEPLYAAHCAGCHGAPGQKAGKAEAPNLADHDWLYGEGAVSDIERVVDYGIRDSRPKTWALADMPAFATPEPKKGEKLTPLTPRQMHDVTEFIYGLSHKDANGAASARGATVFHSVGGCYDCHSGDAGGDPAIGAPNLTDSIWLYGDGRRETIYAAIARGMRNHCPGWWGVLKPYQTRAIAVYVQSLSHKK